MNNTGTDTIAYTYSVLFSITFLLVIMDREQNIESDTDETVCLLHLRK